MAPTTAAADNQAYEEAMDDVHTRFILNLPDEELQSAPRIFFQLEQAWWFYDDFLCDGAAAAAAAAAAEAESNADGGGKGKKKKAKKNSNNEEPLPRFKHVKPFAHAMFQFSPLLQHMLPDFDSMYDEFSRYKRQISTYGTILLNADATKVALCRVYKGKSWTLPGGKVNQNESGKDAAARETYEETGFDPECERGVCGDWMEMRKRGESVDEVGDDLDGDDARLLPWGPLQDSDKLVYTEGSSGGESDGKRRTCYVCRGVPESFPFEPVARKEVSEIKWHELSGLPKHTYAVLPFMNQLRRWIRRDNRKRGIVGEEQGRPKSRSGSRPKGGGGQQQHQPQSTPKVRGGSRGKGRAREDYDDDDDDFGLTPFFSDEGNAPWEGAGADVDELFEKEEDGGDVGDDADAASSTKKKRKEKKRDNSRGKKSAPRAGSRSSRCSSRGGRPAREVSASDPLVASALASPGDRNRWTEDEMFAANEVLLGRKITYDGNPHDFAEKGFEIVVGEGRVDPHAFRVVGGAFMNSGEAGGTLSAPPDASALQPLMNARRRSGSHVSGLSGDDHAGEGGDDDDFGGGLTPFFSDDGRAPWEEDAGVPAIGGAPLPSRIAAKDLPPPPAVRSADQPPGSNAKGLALLSRLRQGSSAAVWEPPEVPPPTAVPGGGDEKKKRKKKKGAIGDRIAEGSRESSSNSLNDVFMTDREITARSQKEKLSILPPLSSAPLAAPQSRQQTTDSEHLVWMRQWAEQLPKSPPTKEFGDFRIDVDAVMGAVSAVTSRS